MNDPGYIETYVEFMNNYLSNNEEINKHIHNVAEYYFSILVFTKNDPQAENVIDFMNNLKTIFLEIEKENKLDNLDNYIDFILQVHTPWYLFADLLRMIIFKDQKNINKHYYYETFKELCHLVNLRFDEKVKMDIRIAKIMAIYRKYHESIPYEGVRSRGAELRIYYEKYASLIAANFYLSNYDISVLDKILAYFTSNISDIYEKYALNGICDLAHFRSSLDFDAEIQFSKFFINNELSNRERVIR